MAILGPSEMCTGDSVRRSGNEYLFQMLAMPDLAIHLLDAIEAGEQQAAHPPHR